MTLKKVSGFSLIEFAIAMAIVGVLTMAMAQVFTHAMKAQMEQSYQVHYQSLMSNILDQLRFDVRNSAVLNVNGNRLTITPSTGGPNIVYNDTGATLTRTINGQVYDYRQLLPGEIAGNTQINCGDFMAGSNCFNLDPGATRVSMYALEIQDTRPLSSNFQQQFGNANLRIPEASFSKLEGLTFN